MKKCLHIYWPQDMVYTKETADSRFLQRYAALKRWLSTPKKIGWPWFSQIPFRTSFWEAVINGAQLWHDNEIWGWKPKEIKVHYCGLQVFSMPRSPLCVQRTCAKAWFSQPQLSPNKCMGSTVVLGKRAFESQGQAFKQAKNQCESLM